MQDSRAFVRAPPGDGFPEPWAHAGRHHGDPRLARYCVRGNRPVINLSGPIRNESLTPDRVTPWRRATRFQHHILGGNLPKPVNLGRGLLTRSAHHGTVTPTRPAPLAPD